MKEILKMAFLLAILIALLEASDKLGQIIELLATQNNMLFLEDEAMEEIEEY